MPPPTLHPQTAQVRRAAARAVSAVITHYPDLLADVSLAGWLAGWLA